MSYLHKFKTVFVFSCSLLFMFLTTEAQTGTKEIDSLLKLLETGKVDTTHVKNLHNLSKSYFSAAQYKLADIYAKQSLSKAKLINYQKGIVMSNIILANINLSLSNYDSTISYLNMVLKMRGSLSDKKITSAIFSFFSIAYINKGNYDLALSYQLKSLQINESLKDSVGIAGSLNNIGNTFKKLNKLDKALEYYFKALNIYEQLFNEKKKADVYTNIGGLYSLLKKNETALEYLFKALTIHNKNLNKPSIIATQSIISNIYFEQNNIKDALIYLKKTALLCEEVGDKKNAAIIYSNIGQAYSSKLDFVNGEFYFNKALDIAQKIGLRASRMNIYGSLAEVKEQKHEYKDALKYQKLYTSLKDTLFNTESDRQITEMNTKYETELKDKELIKKDSEIKMQQANSEKQTIIRNGFIVGFVFLLGIIIFVYRSYTQKQKTNKLLNDKNQKITDSINYAKLIQSSILPTMEDIKKYLPQSFVYYQPKDIVSGDFYWLYPIDETTVLFAVVDCTGHGVPGAMMSMLGYSLLEQIINQNKNLSTANILDQLDILVIESLKQSGNIDAVKNGMDMAIFKLNYKTYDLQYAGAKNPLYVIRDQSIIELKADKKSIGLSNGATTPFTNQTLQLQQGDEVYAFSDGFVDQKGGAENKKFYSANFQKLLISISSLNTKEKSEQIEQAFVNWKGTKEQMDDVLVFGLKV